LFKLQGYTVDRDLLGDVLERLGSPALRAEYSRVRGDSVARAQSQVQAQQQAAKQEQERWKTQDQELMKPQQQQSGISRQLARCLAAGRSQEQCFTGKGGQGGLGMMPLFSNESAPPGISLTGAYSLPSGFSIWFYPEYAHITCKDVKADAGYTIDVKENQVLVRLVPSKTIGLGVKLNEEITKLLPQSSNPDEWQGQRIAFLLRGDGKLAGSGPINVTGNMVVGTGKERDPRTLEMTDVTYTQTKTSSCTLGVLNSTGPSPVLGSFEQIVNKSFDIASGIKDKAEAKNPPPGLRINGSYVSQSGFDVEFYPDSAVVSCRDATVARDYSVSPIGNKVLVNIQNGATPIQLEYKPDGKLVGSGSVEVDGRMFVGMKDRVENGVVVHDPVFNGLVIRDPVFRPMTDTCTLGVLAPGSPGTSGSPTTTQPALAPNNPPAATTQRAAGGNAVLTVTSLRMQAGARLLLLRDSFENALRKGGVQPPPGTSAMKVWLNACASQQALCQQAMAMTAPLVVSRTVIDANGKAEFPAVPAGTYYVFASTRYNNQPFFWDLRVDLRPGANAVTLDQRNSAPIN
jgi:hypothetical protein